MALQYYSFLVPDGDFHRASDLLEHMGLPLQTPSKFSLLTGGDMQAKGRSHFIRQSKITAFDHHLVVYPLSFAAFRSCELSEQPARYSELHRCSHILVPRPAAVYASLMRMMLRYPTNSTTWTILRGEVADLNLYHLLGYTLETVSDEEDEKDENKRVDAAVETVRGWSARREWADGEEWIGSELCGLLCGDRTCFPQSGSQ